MRKLKILQCLAFYLPIRIGGIEVYVRALNRELRAKGHDVKVVVPAYPGEAEYPAAYDDIPILTYHEELNASKAEFTGDTPGRGLPGFMAILQREQPDIVHFHQFTSSNGISIFHIEGAGSLGIGIMYTNHLAGLVCQTGELLYRGTTNCDGIVDTTKCAICDLKRHNFSERLAKVTIKTGQIVQAVYPRLSGLSGKLPQLLSYPELINRKMEKVRRLMSAVDRFIVLTDWYYKVLQTNGLPLNNVRLIRQGLPVPGNAVRVRKTTAAGLPVRLVFMGRIYPDKGLLVLMNALKDVGEGQVSLDIYGQIDDKAYAQKCRDVAGERTNIRWHDSFDHREILKIISRFDLLVLPSMIAEMAPLVIQEAFFAGVPVIGSNCGGIAEAITEGQNGFLFEMGNTTELRNKLLRIISRPSVLQDMSENLPAPRFFGEVAAEVETEYYDLIKTVRTTS
jgi:glycosyltransferase involved in cell wall biosynthesis